jgi:mannose-6-phosphate isomerase-like protein (cupin superfamily)
MLTLDFFLRSIERIDIQKTNHLFGQKKVIFNSSECHSKITQIAFAELMRDEVIQLHKHETMEEIFFLISGECIFNISNTEIQAFKSNCIKIPPNTLHSIKAISDCSFFYFGVAI